MDKQKILTAFIELIAGELDIMIRAAEHARESAINDEIKQEGMYDTRGLEASYLAGAQANRASDLKQALTLLKALEKNKPQPTEKIIEGSIVLMENQETNIQKNYIILPKEGGLKVEVDGNQIVSLSSSNPLGEELIGRIAGESFEIELNKKVFCYLIQKVR